MKRIVEKIKLPFGRSDQGIADQRSSDLELTLPKISGKFKPPELSPKKLEAFYAQYVNDRSSIIREVAKYLEQLNRVEVKAANRQEINNYLMPMAGPIISDAYKKYVRQGSSFPEENERKTILTYCINVLRDLITSYKFVLMDSYTQPAKKFNQLLERMQYACIRIFELTEWLQRILALRYQRLTNREWSDCNRIFAVLKEVASTEREFALTEGMELHKTNVGNSSVTLRKMSAGKLYASIQLFGLLDINTLPAQVMGCIDSYIDSLEIPVDIVDDEGQEPGSGLVVTYRDHDAPPRFIRMNDARGVLIDISPLIDKVHADQQELMKRQFIGSEEKKRLRNIGAAMSISESLPLLELLEKNLRYFERKDVRKALYGSKYINLYAGFAASYRYLHDMHGGGHPEEEHHRHFRSAVAKHSSLLIEGEVEEIESRWQVINESHGGFLIKTGETKYMNSMDVGYLVAFSLESENQPVPHGQLGYITRLHRSREGDVDVAVVKISQEAEQVTVFDPANESASDMVPAILVKDLEGTWKLILPRQSKFISGSPLMLKGPKRNMPIRLGDQCMTKTGFSMFEVRGPGL